MRLNNSSAVGFGDARQTGQRTLPLYGVGAPRERLTLRFDGGVTIDDVAVRALPGEGGGSNPSPHLLPCVLKPQV